MKEIIKTNGAPSAIGPYSQGIKTNELVFVSGQLPIDINTGEFPEGGIKEQTKQSINNLKAVLEAADSGLEKIVKTTVFLKDMKDFAAMNEVYTEMFGNQDCPARSAVQVVALPKDALVEIEAIAVK